MSGYYVVSLFRWTGGETEHPFKEMDRKWYRWRWMAEWAARPRYFAALFDDCTRGVILTRVVPAIAIDARSGETDSIGITDVIGSTEGESAAIAQKAKS